VHHQQIRDALRKPGLKEPRFFAPVLATFVRALPHTFRDVTADEGVAVTLVISGESGGEWSLVRERDKWELYSGVSPTPDSSVVMDQDVAWRLFTKGISKSEAISASRVDGEQALGLRVLDTVSIIA